jgi:ATP-dependent Lon protease
VKLHNSGTGYSEREAQQRDAAVFRRMAAGPWRRCAAPIDSRGAIAQLRSEFPHMSAAVDVLAEQLELSAAVQAPLRVPPMLLVGPPGVGKTYFASRVAEILGAPMRLVDYASQQTNSMLHGSDRHWSNTKPGLLFDMVVLADIANPVIVLDEIDKAASGGDNKYDPIAPLHVALEPSTARRTRDISTELEFDASAVIYIATANSLKRLPDSLLSRMRLIHCEAPDASMAFDMAMAVTRRVMASAKGQHFNAVSRSVVRELAGRTPRDIVRSLERAMARAVCAGRRTIEVSDLEVGNAMRPVH